MKSLQSIQKIFGIRGDTIYGKWCESHQKAWYSLYLDAHRVNRDRFCYHGMFWCGEKWRCQQSPQCDYRYCSDSGFPDLPLRCRAGEKHGFCGDSKMNYVA